MTLPLVLLPHVPRSTLVLFPCPPFTLVLLPMSPVPPWFYFPCPPLRLGSTPHVPSSTLVLLPISPAPPWFYGYHPSHPLPLALLPLLPRSTPTVPHSPWFYSLCPPRSTAPVSHSPWFYSLFPHVPLVILPQVLLPQSPTPPSSTQSPPLPLLLLKELPKCNIQLCMFMIYTPTPKLVN